MANDFQSALEYIDHIKKELEARFLDLIGDPNRRTLGTGQIVSISKDGSTADISVSPFSKPVTARFNIDQAVHQIVGYPAVGDSIQYFSNNHGNPEIGLAFSSNPKIGPLLNPENNKLTGVSGAFAT